MDEAGYTDTKICASGDLDEYSINSLKNQGAKIDFWGVGTKLITSADMPALGGANSPFWASFFIIIGFIYVPLNEICCIVFFLY